MIPLIARAFPQLGKSASLAANLWSMWPVFLGAGIKVARISDDFLEIDVTMKLTARNSNYVGTHFGGSLYAMTDPFYMMMFIKNLGRDYIVWDKAAKISFLKPGKGKVKAEFRLTQEDLDHVIQAIDQSENGKYLWDKTVEVKNEAGEVVARIDKTLYFRKKESKSS